jgi:hypothetical protein
LSWEHFPPSRVVAMSSTVTKPPRPSLHLQRVDFESIPIIDLSKLHTSNSQERLELAQEIDQACTQVGFFYIKVQFICPDFPMLDLSLRN